MAKASPQVELVKLCGCLAFSMRRARRLLQGPRREVVEEALLAALQLLEEEVIRPVLPRAARPGGLQRFVALAKPEQGIKGTSGFLWNREATEFAPGGAAQHHHRQERDQGEERQDIHANSETKMKVAGENAQVVRGVAAESVCNDPYVDYLLAGCGTTLAAQGPSRTELGGKEGHPKDPGNRKRLHENSETKMKVAGENTMQDKTEGEEVIRGGVAESVRSDPELDGLTDERQEWDQ